MRNTSFITARDMKNQQKSQVLTNTSIQITLDVIVTFATRTTGEKFHSSLELA